MAWPVFFTPAEEGAYHMHLKGLQHQLHFQLRPHMVAGWYAGILPAEASLPTKEQESKSQGAKVQSSFYIIP